MMQPQPQLTAPPVTFVNQGYDTQRQRMTFSRKGMKICSILLMAFGSGSFICGFTRLFLVGVSVKYAGAGIWCGVFMIISGILGILGSKRESKCLIIACMVMSILSTLASVNLLGFSSGSVASDQNGGYMYSKDLTQPAVAFESIEIMFSIAAFVVSILLSAICCQATCCCTEQSYQNQPQVVYAPQRVQVPAQTTYVQGTYPMSAGGAQIAVITPGGGTTMYPQGMYTYGQPPAYFP